MPVTLSALIALQVLGDLLGVLAVGVREQHHELLAAVAAGEVALAERRPERGADRGQDVVAVFVAEDVVDLLEVVEVESTRRGGVTRAAWATMRMRLSRRRARSAAR